MMTRVLPAALLCWAPLAGAVTPEAPAFSAGGLLFGDLSYVPGNHLDSGKDAAGLVARRGYFTLDATFSASRFGRARLEINQSGSFETYTFRSQLKDLYLGWKPGRQRLLLGLSPTPTFDLVESIWDFRYLARTPMDLQGAPSRDTGVSMKGPLNTAGTLSYRAMYGAPVEFGADSDPHSKWMGAVSWKPASNWSFDLYVDYQPRPGLTNRTTLQFFAARQSERFTWGIQYSHQERQDDPNLELASAFAWGRIAANTRLVGRIDRLFEPSPKGNSIAYLPYDPTARATSLFSGIEFQASPHFFITPNTVVTYYDRNDQGVRPATDFYLRLTLFINFE
jgi:hypothetical protein